MQGDNPCQFLKHHINVPINILLVGETSKKSHVHNAVDQFLGGKHLMSSEASE